jgi:cystathionine beta-lyase/cystathionine gamma-synthase
VVASVVSSDDLGMRQEVQRRIITFGGCLDPHAALAVLAWLRTFRIRLAGECRTAAALADDMAAQDGISHVIYPGRHDHPAAAAVVARFPLMSEVVVLDPA